MWLLSTRSISCRIVKLMQHLQTPSPWKEGFAALSSMGDYLHQPQLQQGSHQEDIFLCRCVMHRVQSAAVLPLLPSPENSRVCFGRRLEACLSYALWLHPSSEQSITSRNTFCAESAQSWGNWGRCKSMWLTRSLSRAAPRRSAPSENCAIKKGLDKRQIVSMGVSDLYCCEAKALCK